MIDLRITAYNTSDVACTFRTLFDLGFHDGSFDLFHLREAATPGLGSLA